MDSDFQQQQYQHHFQDLQKQFQHQKQQVNSLTRFRSAPSSYFASFLDAADTVTNTGGANGGDRGDISNTKGDFFNARPLSPETENILSKFVSSMDDGNNSLSQNLCEIPENSQMRPELTAKVKQEGDYNTSSPMIYHSTSKPPLANQHSSASAASSVRMHSKPLMKIGIGGRDINTTTTSLTRHSSSPAGFFDNLNIDGYGVVREMGSYGSGSSNNDQVNYSSGQPSTRPGLMRQNSQVEEKIMKMNSLEETNFSNGISSWADSILSETIPGLDEDDDRKIFSEQNLSENQTGESRGRASELARHLSLPSTTTSELSAMEKLLYLQDAVPLRIRAKRGFATHPRSIAERVRRTKISERMRKLQDLVPNMDKQTNTADMLELAVDYIKDLRKQVTTLHGNQAKCTCPR
ncbi:transcription factor bHLH122-like isoform X2 [Silene latifolia]